MRWVAVLFLTGLGIATEVARGEERILEPAGVPIHCLIEGEGPPLLLVHGFAASADLFRRAGLVESLADEFEVIAVDCRGHGRSGKPHDPAEYGPKMVADLVGVLDELGIEEASVFGYSMGGMLAMKLFTDHPDRISAAVVGGYGWSEGFGPLFGALQPDSTPGAEKSAEIRGIEQMLLAANDPLALAAVVRGFEELTLEEAALRENVVPVLAIIGSEDPLRPDVDRMVGVLAELEVEVIEGGDHMTAPMSPRFLPAVQEFLRFHLGLEAPEPFRPPGPPEPPAPPDPPAPPEPPRPPGPPGQSESSPDTARVSLTSARSWAKAASAAGGPKDRRRRKSPEGSR